jgi:hypothetical protein
VTGQQAIRTAVVPALGLDCSHTAQPTKQQQQQQQLPSVAPVVAQRQPKRKLAAPTDAAAAAVPLQLDAPPVLLSSLLRQLGSPRLSADAAEAQLAALLAAAGGLGRLLPEQG